jgi:hypothetical protein
MSEQEVSWESGLTEEMVRKIVEFLVSYDMLARKLPEAEFKIDRGLRRFLKEIEVAEIEEDA